ncbi:MAG: hypothetical protein H7X99_12190 [Saprospiraceae bacterium]|nr:hypothetical protein [Saprospiraceae bacterium]
MIVFSEKKYRWEWLLATIILMIVFSLVYKKILNHPNQFLVSGGDGMKNYYTFMYHVKYDTTFMTFEGMNYPFGENIIFTDNQPLLANVTKVASGIFPSIICYLPSVHNLSLLFGLIFGALGLFLVFRQLKIDFIFSLVVTIGLMLLHPQSDRLHGHFAMFYPILPWLFLGWLKIWDGSKVLKWSIMIGLIITFSGLLHMYFFITGAILCCLAFFVWIISKNKKPSLIHMSGMFVLQIIIPFIILQFFTSSFNHVDDRPSNPYGFFSYHSYWEGLLFSYKLPLFNFINNNVTQIREFDSEGKSYIGIASVLVVLYGLYFFIKHYRTPFRLFHFNTNQGKLISIFMLSALISFGLPFTFPGLEWLLDYTGPFKQFRSIGRVAWVSFYAINLVSIPLIYQWLKSKENVAKKNILYVVFLGLILTEGILYFTSRPISQNAIDAYYCQNNYTDFPVKGSEYQAMLPDPYFSVGSECFSWWDQGHNVNQSFELGYTLHLPTMGVNMSRTSFRQAFLLNELTCLPYKVPDIINIIKQKDTRPLLVIETKHVIHEPRARLTHWTKYAPIVHETDQFRLRRLELNMFDSIVHHFTDSISSIQDTVPVEKQALEFVKVKGSNGWGYETYLSINSTINGQHKVSYWLECTDATRVHAITEVWQFDGHDHSLEYIGEANRFNYKRYDGNKLLIEIPVNIKSETVKLVVRISKDHQKEKEDLHITDGFLRKQ